MRARYRFRHDAVIWMIIRDDKESNNYKAFVESNGQAATIRVVTTSRGQSTKFVLLGSFPLPERLVSGEEYKMELRVIGDELILLVNDRLLGSVRDKTHSKRGFCNFYATGSEFRDAAWLDLGSEASSP